MSHIFLRVSGRRRKSPQQDNKFNNISFSVVTIFFAVKLARAELPEWLDYILVAYVAFHVVMHFIFSVS